MRLKSLRGRELHKWTRIPLVSPGGAHLVLNMLQKNGMPFQFHLSTLQAKKVLVRARLQFLGCVRVRNAAGTSIALCNTTGMFLLTSVFLRFVLFQQTHISLVPHYLFPFLHRITLTLPPLLATSISSLNPLFRVYSPQIRFEIESKVVELRVAPIACRPTLHSLGHPGTLTPWHPNTLTPWHPGTLTP